MKRKILHTPLGRFMAKIVVAHKKKNAVEFQLTPSTALRAHMQSGHDVKVFSQLVTRISRRKQERMMHLFTHENSHELFDILMDEWLKEVFGLNESFDAKSFLESHDQETVSDQANNQI